MSPVDAVNDTKNVGGAKIKLPNKRRLRMARGMKSSNIKNNAFSDLGHPVPGPSVVRKGSTAPRNHLAHVVFVAAEG